MQFADNRSSRGDQQNTISILKESNRNVVQRNSNLPIRAESAVGRIDSTIQMFASPAALEEIKNKVSTVQHDIRGGTVNGPTGKNDTVPGSEEWARETYLASDRKLEEWYLVQHMFNNGVNIAHATQVGFGLDTKTEPDVWEKNQQGQFTKVGESKLVTGKWPRVIENIDSALTQLTDSDRAKTYNGMNLLGRVVLQENSDALKHFNNMSQPVKKSMQTRWNSRLDEFVKIGKIKQKNNRLELLIVDGATGQEIFKDSRS